MNHWQTAMVLTAGYFSVTIFGWASIVGLVRRGGNRG